MQIQFFGADDSEPFIEHSAQEDFDKFIDTFSRILIEQNCNYKKSIFQKAPKKIMLLLVGLVAALSNIYGPEEFGQELFRLWKIKSGAGGFGLLGGFTNWFASGSVNAIYIDQNLENPTKKNAILTWALAILTTLPTVIVGYLEIKGNIYSKTTLAAFNTAGNSMLYRSGIYSLIHAVTSSKWYTKGNERINRDILLDIVSAAKKVIRNMTDIEQKNLLDDIFNDFKQTANTKEILKKLLQHGNTINRTKSQKVCSFNSIWNGIAWLLGFSAVSGYTHFFAKSFAFSWIPQPLAIAICLLLSIPNASILSTSLADFPKQIKQRVKLTPFWWSKASGREKMFCVFKQIVVIFITLFSTFNSAGLAYNAFKAYSSEIAGILVSIPAGLGTIGLNYNSTNELLSRLFSRTEEMDKTLDILSMLCRDDISESVAEQTLKEIEHDGQMSPFTL